MSIASIRRKRLPREHRERLILEEAVRFFSEVGFEGQTRALAERLGVTQPLLYRYFTDKEALIGRVFDEVYLKVWNNDWDLLLADRSRPLLERLIAFYKSYRRTMFEPQWVRIFMFAGLKGERINDRYFENLQQKVIRPMCVEMRHELNLPPPSDHPIDEQEINIAWAIHGAVFNIAVRKWICNLEVPDDMDSLIEGTLNAFVLGCTETFRRIHAPQPSTV